MEAPTKILVIDDNEDDRALYRRVLKVAFEGQLRLTEAGSGEGGFDAIETAQPCCVLLDYSLPGRNGIEVLKRIRSKYAHLPVIMLTGQGNESIAVQSMKEGAQDYINKASVTPDTLSRVIRIAIENHTLQQRVDEQRVALELFTHALAHDLREPVRAVRSFSRMIRNGEVEEADCAIYMRHICGAGDRMALLIDSVLSYTQLDGQRAPQHEAFSLGEAVAAAAVNLAALIDERDAMLRVDPLPAVTGSRIQVIQVLQNLIANAIGHSPRPVCVRICATRDNDAIRVFVHDDGPGIAPEYLGQIFEPFRRLNRDDGHSGLGLAISRKIVEMHGGTIGCTAAIGLGASFYFTLPDGEAVAEVSVPAAPAIAAGEPVAGSAIANVLLVDDREDDIMLAQNSLTGRHGMNCKLMIANHGEDGLAVIREQGARNDPIDLILVDINMPIMDGFEMLEALWAETPLGAIPVVMCSGSTREKDKERSRALGAAGYLLKPVKLADLQPVIAQLRSVRLVPDAAGRPQLMRLAAGKTPGA